MPSNLLRYYNTYGTAIIVAESESDFRITIATLYLAFTGELFWVSILRILEKIDRVITTPRRTGKKERNTKRGINQKAYGENNGYHDKRNMYL